MSAYVESSAVLAWLLEEPSWDVVVTLLDEADALYTSELTAVECDRALVRAVHLGDLTEEAAGRRRAAMTDAMAGWTFMQLSGDILTRARSPFPAEPVRTLDALHLASALLARSALTDLELLTLDSRIRQNGRALGFELSPRDV